MVEERVDHPGFEGHLFDPAIGLDHELSSPRKRGSIIPNFAIAKFARRAAAKNPEGVLSRLAGYPGFFPCIFLCNSKIWDTSLIRPDSRRIWSSAPSLTLGAYFFNKKSEIISTWNSRMPCRPCSLRHAEAHRRSPGRRRLHCRAYSYPWLSGPRRSLLRALLPARLGPSYLTGAFRRH